MWGRRRLICEVIWLNWADALPYGKTGQGTSGWLWDFLPGRTWAEILSFLWPDIGSRISGQNQKPEMLFFPETCCSLAVDCLRGYAACAAATGKAGGAGGAPLRGKLWACVTCAARTVVTNRATRTCALRLSPCPTAPALSPTVLIHLHSCQASTAGKLGPQGRMGRIAGVRGDAWHMVALECPSLRPVA
jgi:hypothetical protein